MKVPNTGLIHFLLVVVGAIGLAVLIGCDNGEASDPPAVAAQPAPPTEPSQTPAEPAAEDPRPRVVFLGDSLTAGFGLDPEQAFPALVADALAVEGLPVQIVNGGVSGDTTAGGLRRIDWLLRQAPDLVVIGLGGNDGLRGIDPASSEQNLRQIIKKTRAAGAEALLLGMLIPPNYGPEYVREFRDLYPRLASQMSVPLVPFLLEGVGGEARLNLPDGIHPTAEGHRIVAANVLPLVRQAVQRHLAAPATRPATDAASDHQSLPARP